MRASGPTVAGTCLVLVLAGCGSRTASQASGTPQAASRGVSHTGTVATAGATPARSASPQPSTTPRASTAPTCTSARLSLSQGSVDGTAGSSYATYYLRNVGPGGCVMSGYPGFALLSANGEVIQHPATRTGQPYRVVILAPGQRARFVVRTLDASIPGTGCSTGWKTTTVQVYPPGQRVALRQPSNLPACDLSVSPTSAT